MSQIEGDLLVHIVQAYYRFSTKSPFFPPKCNSVIVCSVCEFSHFFIILFRFVYTEKQSLGREQISACLTHFCLLAFSRTSSGQISWATPDPSLTQQHQQRGWRKFLQTLILAWEGLLASQLSGKQAGAKALELQELQEQAGLPGPEAAAAAPANTVQLEEGMGMFQVSHILASEALMENESSWAHPRGHESKKKKRSLHKAFLAHPLLIYQRLAMDVYHILGSQGSEPRNESEGRMAGGKNSLSTLLLFLVVHAKIKQQLKKSLHLQSCGNDCWSSNHSASTSPCRKRTKEMYYWTSFFPL